MKVILTHEVSSLGTAGDVVDVKDGYARNFLFRRGLATAWTKGGQKQVDSINRGREVRAINSLEEAKSIKGNLENKAVKVSAHAGASGRLFGAVERLREQTGLYNAPEMSFLPEWISPILEGESAPLFDRYRAAGRALSPKAAAEEALSAPQVASRRAGIG